jgi:hypothetical protein
MTVLNCVAGVLHSYMYGSLYNPQSKIIVRTTVGDDDALGRCLIYVLTLLRRKIVCSNLLKTG